MSLVGSLADLGLGDILQIVSLSRKSGLLLIHSDEGEGRIVFCDGLVQAAYLKGEPDDLRGLLVTPGLVEAEEFYRAEQLANERDEPLEQIIPQFTSFPEERLEAMVREHVERIVFRIFSWTGGEFSFEVREQIDMRDRGILLPKGINAQFLTMEATRLGDEGGRGEAEAEVVADDAPSAAGGEDPVFSGEVDSVDDRIPDEREEASGEFEVASEEPEDAPGEPEDASEEIEPVEAESEPEPGGDVPDPRDVVALAAARRAAPEREEPVSTSAAGEGKSTPASGVDRPACLIAIDPNLGTLEWEKANLADLFPRVHIFQSAELGVARIRQYLSRGTLPLILVSVDLPDDPMSRGDGVAGFVRRLKVLAPSMPVLIATYEDANAAPSVDAADAVVTGPHPRFLVNRHDADKLREVRDSLRAEIGVWAESSLKRGQGSRDPSSAADAPPQASTEELRKLRVLSERMRDPVVQGDVLSLVLDFAAEGFPRVAMFMVREESAVGIAQRGLPSGGGPNDDEIRELEVPVREVEWFSHVLESEAALRSGPIGDGDRELALRLGGEPPTEVYVAPIVSGGHIVALLYTDSRPGEKPIADTTILEIALHEAGLALERALLERALEQAVDVSNP